MRPGSRPGLLCGQEIYQYDPAPNQAGDGAEPGFPGSGDAAGRPRSAHLPV